MLSCAAVLQVLLWRSVSVLQSSGRVHSGRWTPVGAPTETVGQAARPEVPSAGTHPQFEVVGFTPRAQFAPAVCPLESDSRGGRSTEEEVRVMAGRSSLINLNQTRRTVESAVADDQAEPQTKSASKNPGPTPKAGAANRRETGNGRIGSSKSPERRA